MKKRIYSTEFKEQTIRLNYQRDNQVREQTQIWMDDYNNHRPYNGLGKIPPVKYAKINSSGLAPEELKTITL